MLSEVEVPQPWDLTEFVRRLTGPLGKHVDLRPLSSELTPDQRVEAGITGLIVNLPRSLQIFYDDTTTPVHQFAVVMHELGHYCLGHTDTGKVQCRVDLQTTEESDAEDFGREMVLAVRGGGTLHRPPHSDDPEGVQSLGEALADID
ncbi:hypothetical protein [Lentzea sp. NPDC092896]|uniref:hypothetical protein n=1 Tax=Lentzea sp. NPDC092896 TaxID=3364127 RepID=UPI003801B62D